MRSDAHNSPLFTAATNLLCARASEIWLYTEFFIQKVISRCGYKVASDVLHGLFYRNGMHLYVYV